MSPKPTWRLAKHGGARHGWGRRRSITNWKQQAKADETVCPTTLCQLLLADFFQALFQILVVFLLQRRVLRAAVDVARLVLALVELLAGPLVVDVDLVGVIDDLLHQVRRNKIDSLRIADDHVARQ